MSILRKLALEWQRIAPNPVQKSGLYLIDETYALKTLPVDDLTLNKSLINKPPIADSMLSGSLNRYTDDWKHNPVLFFFFSAYTCVPLASLF